MQPRVLPKPLNPSDRAKASGSKHHTPINKASPETEARVRQLLRSGNYSLDAIAATCGIGRPAVVRISRESRGDFRAEKVNTKCSGEKWCNCVRCRAEAAKTQAVRLAMHAADDAERVDYFRAKIGGAT